MNRKSRFRYFPGRLTNKLYSIDSFFSHYLHIYKINMALLNLLLFITIAFGHSAIASSVSSFFRGESHISTTHSDQKSSNHLVDGKYWVGFKKTPFGVRDLRDINTGVDLSTLSYSNKGWLFYVFDTNYDNKISASELSYFFKWYMQESPTEDEIAAMMSVADTSGDGYISFDEFEVVLSKQETFESFRYASDWPLLQIQENKSPLEMLRHLLAQAAPDDDDESMPGAPRIIPHPLPPLPKLMLPSAAPSLAPSSRWDDGQVSDGNGNQTADRTVQKFSAVGIAVIISGLFLISAVVVAVPYAFWRYRPAPGKTGLVLATSQEDFSGMLDGKPSHPDLLAMASTLPIVQRQATMCDLRIVVDSVEEGGTLDTIPSPVLQSAFPALRSSSKYSSMQSPGYTIVESTSSHTPLHNV